MKKTLIALAACATINSLVMPLQAETLENCGAKVESAAFIADMSGSMMKTIRIETEGKAEEMKKSEAAKEFFSRILNRVNKDLKLETGIYSVGPYAELLPAKAHAEEEIQQGLEKLNTRLEIFGRPTWIGKRAYERFSVETGKTEAIVLVTDGGFQKNLRDPVEAIENYYRANPGSCIRIVSAAQSEEEKAGIEALAAVNRCAKPVLLADLMRDAKAFDAFVREVYYRDCTKVPVIEIYGVNFAFDKAELTAESRQILNRAIEVLNNRDPAEPVKILGWTDWMGTDQYNRGLSERRAKAVLDYFVKEGIDASRLSFEGKGKSFKYTNETAEGRWRNRRVDLIFGSDANAVKSRDADNTPQIIQ